MRPSIPSGKPPPVMRAQFLPASVLFHRPLPGPPPLKPHGTRRRWYDAAYSVFASNGSMTMSVKPVSVSIVFTAAHVLPPSIVL